ncbi:putative ABC-type ATPase [Xanthomonas arboricola]|uniref:AAA family ATPase n=1 Tax=Xanthomonas arboricola TaxID=56448 RepID=UPI0014320D72|nr:AAA family ATPase [Xanthomonas arboricola]NJC30070.1 putative ABC-type ATPase [Xanthomonas arboricola]
MGSILVLAGVNGAGKSSLLGSLLREDGATWFNPDAFTRDLVAQGWSPGDANAQAWQEGVRRLRQAMDAGHDYAFETTLGATTIPRLLRQACATHTVAVWFCGLSSVELHIARVAARVAAGGHAIPEHKIRERYDASRANLIALLPHLSVLHVYDNSAPADATGQVAPLLVLELDRNGLQYPQTPEELAQVPDWAKPIVMAALELRQS